MKEPPELGAFQDGLAVRAVPGEGVFRVRRKRALGDRNVSQREPLVEAGAPVLARHRVHELSKHPRLDRLGRQPRLHCEHADGQQLDAHATSSHRAGREHRGADPRERIQNRVAVAAVPADHVGGERRGKGLLVLEPAKAPDLPVGLEADQRPIEVGIGPDDAPVPLQESIPLAGQGRHCGRVTQVGRKGKSGV